MKWAHTGGRSSWANKVFAPFFVAVLSGCSGNVVDFGVTLRKEANKKAFRWPRRIFFGCNVVFVPHLNARAASWMFESSPRFDNRIKWLTFVAVVAAFRNTLVLLVLHPIGLARQALVAATGGTSHRTWKALFSLLIAVVAVRAAVETFAVQWKSIWLAGDALRLRWTVAGWTRLMAIGAAVSDNTKRHFNYFQLFISIGTWHALKLRSGEALLATLNLITPRHFLDLQWQQKKESSNRHVWQHHLWNERQLFLQVKQERPLKGNDIHSCMTNQMILEQRALLIFSSPPPRSTRRIIKRGHDGTEGRSTSQKHSSSITERGALTLLESINWKELSWAGGKQIAFRFSFWQRLSNHKESWIPGGSPWRTTNK